MMKCLRGEEKSYFELPEGCALARARICLVLEHSVEVSSDSHDTHVVVHPQKSSIFTIRSFFFHLKLLRSIKNVANCTRDN